MRRKIKGLLKVLPRTHALASTGSLSTSCKFDDCLRTRAARRRENWLDMISDEKKCAADSSAGMSSEDGVEGIGE
jgi:hypothetical protein